MRHMPAIWQRGSAGAIAFALLVAPAKPGSDATPNTEKLRHLVIKDCGSCHGLSLKGGLGKPLTAEHLSQWDREQIARGRAELDRVVALGGRGPYALQAAIAAQQARDEPDWRHVSVLYRELAADTGSPVVELNRAAAVHEVDGPAAALELIDGGSLPDVLAGYRYLHATRAELLARLDRVDEARAAYRQAIDLTPEGSEHRSFERRLRELGDR